MPTQGKTELYDAARLLSEEECLQLLAQIAKDYPDLSGSLKEKLINFRFDIVMDLIKPDENSE